MQKKGTKFHLSYLEHAVQGSDPFQWDMLLLALRTLSRLDLTSSRGASRMSVALWLLHKKCSDTVVGLELLVCLSTGLRCSLKRSLKDHTQPVCFARLCDCYYPGIRGHISHVDLSYTCAWSERNLKSSQKRNFTSLNQKMDENEESSVNVTNDSENSNVGEGLINC